jgi:hypothetical protein
MPTNGLRFTAPDCVMETSDLEINSLNGTMIKWGVILAFRSIRFEVLNGIENESKGWNSHCCNVRADYVYT